MNAVLVWVEINRCKCIGISGINNSTEQRDESADHSMNNATDGGGIGVVQ